MRTVGMLPADTTSLTKFRNGVAGPKDSEVANRWNAFLPNLAAVRPNVGQKIAQVVHTDGVVVSVVFIRPKPAELPGELPRKVKEEGAVNPLAPLDADWLGCDPGKTNMATVAHEERYPSGASTPRSPRSGRPASSLSTIYCRKSPTTPPRCKGTGSTLTRRCGPDRPCGPSCPSRAGPTPGSGCMEASSARWPSYGLRL
ncbi:hypothetical protein HaLaN_09950, partial [Haematococcus lacustris]